MLSACATHWYIRTSNQAWMCSGWDGRHRYMNRKTIRDLLGGALLIATAIVYFWATVPRWPDEGAAMPAVTIEAADSPSTKGV